MDLLLNRNTKVYSVLIFGFGAASKLPGDRVWCSELLEEQDQAAKVIAVIVTRREH